MTTSRETLLTKITKVVQPSRFTFGMVAAGYLGFMALLELLGFVGFFNQYYIHVLIIIGMNIILVTSLNLVNGFLGEFALGHAGFMAIGAYTAAIIATHFNLPFPLNLILALAGGMAAAGAIGYLVGLVTFKTVGDYLAIITLGFNMIIVNAIQNIEWVGGPRGYTGIPKTTSLIVVAISVVLTLVVIRNMVNSNFGRLWVSIRENTIAAELMGVSINRAKNIAFTLAAAFAGLAGGLLAQYQQSIYPTSFDYIKTTEILVMLYLGGMGSLSGSILGVLVYTIMMELLRNILSVIDPRLAEWRMLLSPLILIVIMLTRQYGLMGNREWHWILQREEEPLQ